MTFGSEMARRPSSIMLTDLSSKYARVGVAFRIGVFRFQSFAIFGREKQFPGVRSPQYPSVLVRRVDNEIALLIPSLGP